MEGIARQIASMPQKDPHPVGDKGNAPGEVPTWVEPAGLVSGLALVARFGHLGHE
jgi:hypothetical protein